MSHVVWFKVNMFPYVFNQFTACYILFLKFTLIQCLQLYEVFSHNFEWRLRVDKGGSYGDIGKHFIIRIYNILSSG